MRVSLPFTQPLWDKAVRCGGGTHKGEGTELSSLAGVNLPVLVFPGSVVVLPDNCLQITAPLVPSLSTHTFPP